MKKRSIFALLLAFMLLLCSCGAEQASQDEGLRTQDEEVSAATPEPTVNPDFLNGEALANSLVSAGAQPGDTALVIEPQGDEESEELRGFVEGLTEAGWDELDAKQLLSCYVSETDELEEYLGQKATVIVSEALVNGNRVYVCEFEDPGDIYHLFETGLSDKELPSLEQIELVEVSP